MSVQLDENGQLRHFLTTEGLDPALLTRILDTAESFSGVIGKSVKKVPLLRGRTVINLFFESSTRTRTTFELAAKRLSADVLNVSVDTTTTKGESLLDMLRNLQAMQADMFRHPSQPERCGRILRAPCRPGRCGTECRRWLACASHAGHAGCLHHPSAQG